MSSPGGTVRSERLACRELGAEQVHWEETEQVATGALQGAPQPSTPAHGRSSGDEGVEAHSWFPPPLRGVPHFQRNN